MKIRLDKRGQFSIIAALLVAIILVATVMSTYAAIRYNSVESQPQTLSSVDEVNQALRQLLGFTVGYYGSILQVTGNASYAQDLSKNYLNSGLQNIAEIRPENGLSFAWENLTLQVDWFGTESYSSGKLNVTYDLGGLGLYGLSFSPECRLDLRVYESASGNPASMSIVQNEQEPLNTLVKDNFKFYHYLDSDQVWELVAPPTDVQVTANGTYYINTPAGVDSSCYTIQVKDARGVMVVGASFNGYASPLTWNSSYSDGDYVDIYNSTVSPPIDIGTHSNFAVQQSTPGSIFDILKEGVSSTTTTDYYPASFTPRSGTTNPSGGLTDLQSEGSGYLQLRSYPSAFGTSTTFGNTTKGATASNFANVRGSKFTCTTGGQANSISSYLSYSPSFSTLGNTATGSSGNSIIDTIRGQQFTSPASLTSAQSISAYLDIPAIFGDNTAEGSYSSGSIENSIRGSFFTATDSGAIQSIKAYIQCTTAAKNMKAALYNDGTNTLIAQTTEISVPTGTTWVTFSFASPPSVTSGNNYVLVVWSFSGSGSAYLYYTTSGGTNQGHSYSLTYAGSFPNNPSFTHSTYKYSIYATFVPQNHNIKGAIYDSSNNLIASTQEASVSSGGWLGLTFASPPTLLASTAYKIVVWAQSNVGTVNLDYSSASGGNGRIKGQTYGSWPSSVSFNSDTDQYCIYCSYTPLVKAQAAIYSGGGGTFGDLTQESLSISIVNNIRGSSFTATSNGYIQSITAYIQCTTAAKNMKASIYNDGTNTELAETPQNNIPAGINWVTFTFDSPPSVTAGNSYVLVVWSQTGSGSANIYYTSSGATNQGHSLSQTYGSWPSPASFTHSTNRYSIYCTYAYQQLATTEEKTLSTTNGWVTFNFPSQPILSPSTDYVLAVWSSDSSNINTYYNAGSIRSFQGSGTYPTWPNALTDNGAMTYSIYCNYTPILQFTAGVEFTSPSNTLDWTQLIWKVNGTCTSAADVTLQLCNQVSGQYPTSGSGYASLTSTTSTNGTWTITTNPANFRDSDAPGDWKMNVTAVSSSQFDLNLDQVKLTPTNAYYGLDLEEQWINVNNTRPNYDLCIKTGALASDALMVDVWNNQSGSGYWSSLYNATSPLLQNTWNNVTVTQYVTSPTFTLRFISNDASDTHQDSWNVSTVELRPQPDLGIILSQQDSTTAVEWLQNGTMRRLGQNLQLNSQEKPIPPIPVRAIHLNQTFVNGTVKEVPFQVEDWASSYRIPLGMSSNETVFSNRQMIVFLMTTDVTQITMWWNGSDIATQTPLAYTNTRFNDNPSTGTLNNGKLTLNFGSGFNPVTSTVGGVTTTANFMRINNEASVYGAGIAYVIYNGVVRDIVQQEAEWNGGADNCPDLYANTVLTLPAGASYYTYQLRLMFINSTDHPRTISDLVPIQLASSISNLAQTEDGTLGTSPVVVNGTGMFYNYAPAGNWTAHHWSQLINTATGEGSGIMFTDPNNQNLYFFDSRGASPAATGALNVNSTAKTIELAPVSSLHSVTSYTTPAGDDITWKGAVATFDGNTTPVYKQNSDNMQSGLWILAEYQPRITVNPMV